MIIMFLPESRLHFITGGKNTGAIKCIVGIKHTIISLEHVNDRIRKFLAIHKNLFIPWHEKC